MICDACRDTYSEQTEAEYHVLMGSYDCDSEIYLRLCREHMRMYSNAVALNQAVWDDCIPSHQVHEIEVQEMTPEEKLVPERSWSLPATGRDACCPRPGSRSTGATSAISTCVFGAPGASR